MQTLLDQPSIKLEVMRSEYNYDLSSSATVMVTRDFDECKLCATYPQRLCM